MAGLICNGGLDYLSGVNPATDSANWTVHLFNNNHTPTSTDTVGSYTESGFPGYHSQVPGAFTTTPAGGGGKSYQSPVMNYISTAASGEQIYGYYVTNISGALLFAEKFGGGPYSIGGAGYGVQLSCTMQDANT